MMIMYNESKGLLLPSIYEAENAPATADRGPLQQVLKRWRPIEVAAGGRDEDT